MHIVWAIYLLKEEGGPWMNSVVLTDSKHKEIDERASNFLEYPGKDKGVIVCLYYP